MHYDEYNEYPLYIDLDSDEQGNDCKSSLDGEFLKVLEGANEAYNPKNIEFIPRVPPPPKNNTEIISLVENTCNSRATLDKYEYKATEDLRGYVLWAYLESNCNAINNNFDDCRMWRYKIGNTCL